MKRQICISMFLTGALFSLQAQSLKEDFLKAQLGDPLNGIHSYNLGMCGLEQQSYEEADRSFSLAVDLLPREKESIVPAYFSWADTAALQLISLLQKESKPTGPELDKALQRAVDASNRYGNVLVFDEVHKEARARKKLVDKIKAFLEQRKKQEEEQKKEEEEKQKNQQDQQENKQDKGDGQQDQKQDGAPEKAGDSPEDKQQKDGDKKEGDAPEKPSDKEAGENTQKQGGSEKKQDDASKDQQEAGRPESSALRQPSEHNEQPRSEADKADGEGEESVAEHMAAEAEEGAAQHDPNALLAKKRALVLLDKLQNEEAALHKQQLLKKTARQAGVQGQYNQW